MKQYAAFIRGINVGGHNSIKMDALRQVFSVAGCEDAITYIQSGNVVFRASEIDKKILAANIKYSLYKLHGINAEVFVRTIQQLRSLIKQDPFAHFQQSGDMKQYVSFLSDAPPASGRHPINLEKIGLNIFLIRGQQAYSVGYRINGRHGNPNNILENQCSVSATTRYWSVINKVAALAVPG